ncbi:MAG: hypothetical protein WC648_03805 [Candidatus Paceibacterota bacterium]|jgi:hypothetical protein
MSIKTISKEALSVIEQYRNLPLGNTVSSVPYYNNKKNRARAALKTFIGKGSPHNIVEEVESIMIKSHIVPETLDGLSLKKIMVDNNIGIECSGFVYHVLEAENQQKNHGPLAKKLSFPNCHGLIGKFRCSIRPVENCDVSTFSHKDNSHEIKLSDIVPGDFISMIGDQEESEHDHIMIIDQVEYEGSLPKIIYYSHAAAYPEDGLLGSGVKKGTITVNDINKPITLQLWTEEGREGQNNRLFVRASKSNTSIRRFNW